MEREFTATTTTFRGGLATSSSFLCKEGLLLCEREEGESVSLLFPALSLTIIQLFRDKALNKNPGLLTLNLLCTSSTI